MLVLSHGLEISAETVELATILGVEVDHYNFARTSSFAPVATSPPGDLCLRRFTAPKDIPISVMEASCCAERGLQQTGPGPQNPGEGRSSRWSAMWWATRRVSGSLSATVG